MVVTSLICVLSNQLLSTKSLVYGCHNDRLENILCGCEDMTYLYKGTVAWNKSKDRDLSQNKKNIIKITRCCEEN